MDFMSCVLLIPFRVRELTRRALDCPLFLLYKYVDQLSLASYE